MNRPAQILDAKHHPIAVGDRVKERSADGPEREGCVTEARILSGVASVTLQLPSGDYSTWAAFERDGIQFDDLEVIS